jgi:cystathionine beta-lyase/cystathionine gamma-synthase
MRPKGPVQPETLLATLATDADRHRGVVNMPVYRASTILFKTMAEFEEADKGKCPYGSYGRYGTVATDALENMIAELEGADHAIVLSCGGSSSHPCPWHHAKCGRSFVDGGFGLWPNPPLLRS